MRIKYRGMLVSDLDGTLLNGDRQISAIDLKALSCARENGYLVVLATGRSNFSFETLLDSLGYSGNENSLPVDYVIFSTGAGIMDYPPKTLLNHFSLTSRDVNTIARRLDTFKLDYMVHMPVPDTRFFQYRLFDDDNRDFHARLSMYGEFGSEISSESLKDYEGATEVLCIVPEASGHEVAAKLSETFQEYSVIKATSPLDGRSIWVEVFSPQVSKSRAVSWLAGRVDISKKHIRAVGNDYNDEDLLNWVAKGYVVANSPSTLTSQFHKVASNAEGGVAEAIYDWLDG